MVTPRLLLIVCVLAASMPWLRAPADLAAAGVAHGFTAWPDRVGTLSLESAPLQDEDRRLLRGFPGQLARFDAEGRHVLAWWTDAPSHQVHSIRECYRGLGYDIEPEPARPAFGAGTWGRFLATRGAERLLIHEQVRDGAREEHSSIPAWYWSAVFGASPAPYTAWVVVERLEEHTAAR